MNVQEREELDYFPASEFENAYAWSRMTRRDDSERINAALSHGYYVLVRESDAYCPSTDAPMGVNRWIAACCETREEAESVRLDDEDECNYYILPRVIE